METEQERHKDNMIFENKEIEMEQACCKGEFFLKNKEIDWVQRWYKLKPLKCWNARYHHLYATEFQKMLPSRSCTTII